MSTTCRSIRQMWHGRGRAVLAAAGLDQSNVQHRQPRWHLGSSRACTKNIHTVLRTMLSAPPCVTFANNPFFRAHAQMLALTHCSGDGLLAFLVPSALTLTR